MKIAKAKTFGNEPYATTSDVASAITSHSTNVGHVPSGGTAGQVLTKTTDGQVWADVQSSSYTLPIATDATLGGIKIGDNLTITEDGTLSADVQDAVEHLSVLPQSWTTSDNGRVFVWEATDGSLSKGHIYKVNTLESAPSILVQLTPEASMPEHIVSMANKMSGLYTPYDTVNGSSGGTVRAYTRYKNPNGVWLAPYISGSDFTNMWMFTDNLALNTFIEAMDYTSASISATKTSLTASDLNSAQWQSGIINSMQSKSFTDVAGGVSADFEDLTPVTNAYTKNETDNLLNAKADKSTTLAGYGITDAYTKTEVDAKVSSVYRYRGTVSTYAGLPVSDQQIGDVYNIETADDAHGIKAGDNVAWNGTAWDVLAGEIDLTAYATKAELATVATTGNYNDLTNRPDLTTKLDAPATAGTVGQVLTKTESGQAWADAKQYTLTPATKTTLGGIKVGDNLTITEDGTLSADVQDNAVEHLSTLPESWTMDDNGRVFVWESASIEGSLSKGHIYKVNTTETASGISLQMTPSGATASTAEKVKGLYTPADTLPINLSNGSTRTYTRYKNQNSYWFAPYVYNSANSVAWMITTDPSGNPGTAVDNTVSINVLKTSLTATDLSSASWRSGFMSQSSPVFTDVAGGVSADFEDLTPASTVDIPIASASTLGGIKVGSRLSIDSNGVLSADEQSSSYTLPAATDATLGGVKVGSRLSIDSNGVLSADEQSYTLPTATTGVLGGVKIGDGLSVASDGTISVNAPSNAVEHLSTLPESWTMDDGGRVFVWEADSTETLSKGHIYKVNTTETASGILIQLTPPAGFPEDFASLANKASGLYTPYDTVEGSSGGTIRVYTRYKSPNGVWLAPYISGGNFTNMWMFTGNPSGNTDTATDYTGTISELKTSLTAADLTSATWGKNFMNSMQSKSFTDVAGGVSADFEDLTPASAVDIPVASTSTLGGVKIGSRLSIDANGVLSADEQSSSYTLPVATSSTLGGVKQVQNAWNPLLIDGDGTARINLDSQQFVTGTDMLSLIIPGDGELEVNPALPGIRVKTASATQKGVVKVGSGLSIDSNGVLSADEQSSSYTLPVASTSTLGGVKVNNSTGALKVASDGLLALLVSSPEAMKNGETGIAVNLKTNGGLMFQTITYGDPTKALGMNPKATYNQLSGSSVTITPSVQPYKLTASGATTLNSSYSFGINDGVVSTGDIAYAEIVIVLGASGSITAGMDLTLVDALTAGKTNYCVVRWEAEKAKLFVWRVE